MFSYNLAHALHIFSHVELEFVVYHIPHNTGRACEYCGDDENTQAMYCGDPRIGLRRTNLGEAGLKAGTDYLAWMLMHTPHPRWIGGGGVDKSDSGTTQRPRR